MYKEKPVLINRIFWSVLVVFCLHLVDETLLNGGFILGVQRHIWAGYDWTKFAITNAAFILLIVVSNYLYQRNGGRWIVLPLFWLWERSLNGIWHILWMFAFREYAPGLATSFLFWILLYWVIRVELPQGSVPIQVVIITGAAAVLFEVLLISSLYIGARL